MKQHVTPRALWLALPLAMGAITSPMRAQQAPQSAKLIRQTAQTFSKIQAMHFTLAAHAITPGPHLSGVAGGEGSVIWPDQLVFNGSMQTTPAFAVGFTMVMCGANPYVEMGDGNFQKMQGVPNLGRLLFAPDTSFIADILTQITQLSAAQAVTLDQVATWHVTGVVPKTLIAKLPGAAPASAGPLKADLWIGQRDLRLHQLLLSGPMFTGDSTQTTRTLAFSRFDDRTPLTVPRGTLPCSASAPSGDSTK